MFGLEGAPVYGAEAREVAEGHPAVTAVDAVTVPLDGIVRWYAPDGPVPERKTTGSRPGVPVAEAVEWFRSQPAAA
jgi:hypothetical protein